jgi:2-alkyl-3-oxoalkanoate reductase
MKEANVKILIAGATGVIGRRLVPLLVDQGHEVVGLSRSMEGTGDLEASGARSVQADVLQRAELEQLLLKEEPEIVIHELTSMPRELEPGKTEAQFAANVRVRTEGTRNLVDAARACGTRRVVAQSYAHVYAPFGGWVKMETDELNTRPGTPEGRLRNVEAVIALEDAVLGTPGVEGVALRYGTFYGPGTAYGDDGSIAALVRRRHYPLVGNARGTTSFVHVDDAAMATLLALRGPTGVFNICDDRPAPLSEWLPFYARVIGAPAPRHVPALAVRMLAREHFVYRSTEQRGASNAKAKTELSFAPVFTSWRAGMQSEFEERLAA